jgi:hypothetical protein
VSLEVILKGSDRNRLLDSIQRETVPDRSIYNTEGPSIELS